MYARVHNDIVIEILTPVDGFTAEQCFHRDLLASCAQVDANVQVGWVLQSNGMFAPPQPIAPAEEPASPTEAQPEAPAEEPAPTQEPDATV